MQFKFWRIRSRATYARMVSKRHSRVISIVKYLLSPIINFVLLISASFCLMPITAHLDNNNQILLFNLHKIIIKRS